MSLTKSCLGCAKFNRAKIPMCGDHTCSRSNYTSFFTREGYENLRNPTICVDCSRHPNIMDHFKRENLLDKLMTEALRVNKEIRHQFGDSRCMSAIAYAREFCTVHVNPGRRTGKTSWALENVEKGDVIIVHNHHRQKILATQTRALVYSVGTLTHSDDGRGLHSRRVIIDEPALISSVAHDGLENIYRCFSRYEEDDVTFILLGS